MPKGVTVWLTGLSGAGKSTIAHALQANAESRGRLVEILDGDIVRENLSRGLGFSKEDRDTNIRRIAFVSHLLTRHGAFVIVAAISPYAGVRNEAREMIGDFVEVHVDCSIDVLTARDTKGLYAKALTGEIKNFTGISDPYEAPTSPELVVSTAREDVAQSVGRIERYLEANGYINTD
ncbi:MAG: adenylyl-sulfate kinase [Chloroflexi bacterium]|nr:adenylyl-sulfate kinase [Chloroflexota bacterium]